MLENIKYKIGVFVLVICACVDICLAQFVQQQRIEQPVVARQSFRQIIPLGPVGALLLVASPKPTSRNNENLWEMICYDTGLVERHSVRFGLPGLWNFKHFITKSAVVLLIFDNPTNTDLFIYKLDVQKGEGENFNYYAPVSFVPDWFKYVGEDDFYVGGRHKYRPIAIHYNMQTHHSHVIQGLYDAQLVVRQQIENHDNTLTLVIERGQKAKQIILQTYHTGGNLVSKEFWRMPKNYKIGSINPFLPDQTKAWIATFTSGYLQAPQGFMILGQQGPEDNQTPKIKFIDFKNFFNHYKKSRKDRVQRRIARYKLKGKDYKLGFKFLMHEPIHQDSLIFVMADAYFPHYSYSTMHNFGYANANQNRTFDGYQFTHYLVCVFDQKANLIWEYSGKASNKISYNLEPHTCFLVLDNKQILAFYHDDSQIFFNVLSAESTGTQAPNIPTNKFAVQGFDNSEERSETEDLAVTGWYGQYLLISGRQTIVNSSRQTTKWMREINFISKIAYLPASQTNTKTP